MSSAKVVLSMCLLSLCLQFRKHGIINTVAPNFLIKPVKRYFFTCTFGRIQKTHKHFELNNFIRVRYYTVHFAQYLSLCSAADTHSVHKCNVMQILNAIGNSCSLNQVPGTSLLFTYFFELCRVFDGNGLGSPHQCSKNLGKNKIEFFR